MPSTQQRPNSKVIKNHSQNKRIKGTVEFATMPVCPSPETLRRHALRCVCKNLELLCYGTSDRHHIHEMCDLETYTMVDGPFTELPGSMLEDLCDMLYTVRCGYQYLLHPLVQPQIRTFKLGTMGSLHYAIKFLKERCPHLKALEIRQSRDAPPNVYRGLFEHFPHLIKLNLSGTIIDDKSFDSLGAHCPNIRDLNLSSTSISDLALKFISVSSQNVPRCQNLLCLDIRDTRVTPQGVASTIYYHANLLSLLYPNIIAAFQYLKELGFTGFSNYKLTALSATKSTVTAEHLELCLEECPNISSVELVQNRMTNSDLYPLMGLQTLTSLHISNDNDGLIEFQEGVLPVMVACGKTLTSLTLCKVRHIDIASIGQNCPHLKHLTISCFQTLVQTPDFSKATFSQLEELEICNNFGAHIFENTLKQMLFNCENLNSLLLQHVDSFNDELWSQMVCQNDLKLLETVVFVQCHSISLYTLEGLLERENKLRVLRCWSCRFISEDNKKIIKALIKTSNFLTYFEWFPFTGERVPQLEEAMEELNALDEEE